MRDTKPQCYHFPATSLTATNEIVGMIKPHYRYSWVFKRWVLLDSIFHELGYPLWIKV